MSSSRYFHASSFTALVLASGLLASAAHAQTPRPEQAARAQANEDRTIDEVVVTGSFIAGTPEDAALPVEVITFEDLQAMGSPSNMDLIKSLTEIGSVAGEANRYNAFAIGAQTVNLRSLSSSRTVVVFNGRRFPEQFSSSVGRFNNIAQIPNAAIGRIEVLKDGGATTYGADAVGGVINYITRRNFDGVEVNANYRYIDGSDGDWDADVLWGRVGDNWNALASIGYQHRSVLMASERDWAFNPFHINNNAAAWPSSGSPGAYVFQRATGVAALPFANIAPPPSGTGIGVYAGNRHVSAGGALRDPFCSELGGFAAWTNTPTPVCYFRMTHNEVLVDETDTWQGYAEFNYRFSDRLKVHTEFMYYKLDIPGTPLNSSWAPTNFPLAPAAIQPPGTQLAPGTGAQQQISATGAYVVPGTNPAVANLIANLRNADGTPTLTAAQQANILAGGGRVGLLLGLWRPFGAGGGPNGPIDLQHNYSDQWRATLELSGDLPEMFGSRLEWKAAFTYNDLKYHIEFEDILIDRLQQALAGFGGPGCDTDAATPGVQGGVAGVGNCRYFNPFSSAIAQNIFTGQTNPGFVGTGSFPGYTPGMGLQNSQEVMRWMYVPLELFRKGQYAIVDFVVSGETGLQLPGGPIKAAVGGQYRRYHETVDLSDLMDRTKNPCATPGVMTCATRTGPLAFNRGLLVTGLTQDQNRKFPVASAFGEIQLPLLDTLTLQLSGRWEKFYSDVTDVDNEVFVPAGSIRWQATPWLALRATAGETFSQVNPPLDDGPTISNATMPAQFGGAAAGQFTGRNYDNTQVRPETGFNYNVGAIVQIGNFQGTIDYYNIEVNDYARTLTTAQIITALVQPGQLGAGALINCSSELLSQVNPVLANQPMVQLNGPCVPGVSRLNSSPGTDGAGGLVGGGAINYTGALREVNAGTLATSGIDVSASYRWNEVYGGTLSVSGDVSYVLDYTLDDFIVAGIPVAAGFEGVGFFNESTGRNNQHVNEWRASITLNYTRGRHSFNWSTRGISSFIDEDLTQYTPANQTNANIGNAQGVTPTGAACTAISPIVSPPAPEGAGSGSFFSGPVLPGANGICPNQNVAIMAGYKIPAMFTSDFTYRLQLPYDTTVSLTVQNVFDKDPAFARSALSYDAFTGSPLGRTYRLGVRKRF